MINGLSGNVESSAGEVTPTALLVPTNAAGVIELYTSISGVGSKTVLSGALTAGVYKELVSISTPGHLRMCFIRTEDVTSRTIGLKIIMDGITVFDGVSPAVTFSKGGFSAVGAPFRVTGGLHLDTGTDAESIPFNSLSIEVKSSLSETDKVSLLYSTAIS